MNPERAKKSTIKSGVKNQKKLFTPKGIRYLKVILFASFGVLILWLITRNQDVSKIWDEFKNARLFWIFLAVVSNIISHVVRAIRWNQLISPLGKTPKLTTTFYALMTGYLANLAVPRLGEISRCGTLSRYSGVPFNALAGTVVAERVFDLITLMGLVFLTIIFQFTFLKAFLNKYIFNPFLNTLSGNVWVLAIIAIAGLILLAIFIYYIKRADFHGKGFSAKVKRQVVGFWNGLLSLIQIKNKILFITLTLLIWFLYFLMVYLCFFALPGTSGLNVADGFTVLAIGSLGILAPVPGGVGTYHFFVITSMTELLSVGLEPATSYAYITHAVQTLIVLILGGYAWLMLSLKIKSKAPVVSIQNE